MAPSAPAAPAPENVGQQTRDTLQAQVDLAPQEYASTAEFQPQYTALQTQELQDATNTLLPWYQNTVYPAISNLSQQATTAQRTANIQDVANLGPEAAAAFQAATPQLTQSVNQLEGQAANVGQDTLLQRLNDAASSNLTSNGQLSPDDLRAAQQQSQAAFSARGLVDSNPAVLSELNNSQQLRQQRLGQAANLAGSVEQLNQNQTNSTRSFLSNLPSIYSQATLNPFEAILGQPTTTTGIANSTVGTAGSSIAGAGPSAQFNPFNSYAQDVYNTNYNANAAANIAGANSAAATEGAGIGAAGTIGSAALLAMML